MKSKGQKAAIQSQKSNTWLGSQAMFLSALTLFLLSIGADAQDLYQWSCSSLDTSNNFYTLPDLNYEDDENVRDIRGLLLPTFASEVDTDVDILRVPSSLNCQGTVSAVEFCYFSSRGDTEFGTDYHVFTLVTLEENNFNFTVTGATDVLSTPTSQKCSDTDTIFQGTLRFCCDNVPLSRADQFRLPRANFAFGIIPTSMTITQLRYRTSVFPQFRVEKFTIDSSIPDVGMSFMISPDSRVTDKALQLFQFVITPDLPTLEPSTTEQPISTEQTIPIEQPISTGQPEQPTFTEQPTSTEQPGFSTTEPSEEPRTITPRGGPSNLGSAIGAAVGGGVAIIALLAIIIVVVVILKRRASWKPEESSQGPGISFKNDIYGAESLHLVATPQAYEESMKSEYAGVGPHVYSSISGENISEYEQIPRHHEYSYALSGAHGIATAGIDNLTYGTDKTYTRLSGNLENERESIYMAPGNDESTLYSQLAEIVTDVITRTTLRLGDVLGSGQFGTVYKGVWQSSTRGTVEVAVKTLNEGSTQEDKIKFLQEATIMGQFKHPNVVEMYGVITFGEPILLVLELLKKGDLRKHLIKMRPPVEGELSVAIDDHTLLNYCRQVASGMAYLSNKAFVHRDLAARNILVSNDDICKIADFGMSRDLMDENYYVSHGGKVPVKWTAPEALHYKKYSTASDVWSYGVLMYEIWSLGRKPYENFTNTEVMTKVDTGYRLPPPPGCPRAIYSIMMKCWHPTKFKRPSFQNIDSELRSRPETELLKWTEEDRQTHPGTDKLGADLDTTQMYKDLSTLFLDNN